MHPNVRIKTVMSTDVGVTRIWVRPVIMCAPCKSSYGTELSRNRPRSHGSFLFFKSLLRIRNAVFCRVKCGSHFPTRAALSQGCKNNCILPAQALTQRIVGRAGSVEGGRVGGWGCRWLTLGVQTNGSALAGKQGLPSKANRRKRTVSTQQPAGPKVALRPPFPLWGHWLWVWADLVLK